MKNLKESQPFASMSNTIEKINELQAKHSLILLYAKDHKVYLLVDHYKYLNPVKEAKKQFIGELKLKDGTHYVTQKVKITKKSRGQE